MLMCCQKQRRMHCHSPSRLVLSVVFMLRTKTESQECRQKQHQWYLFSVGSPEDMLQTVSEARSSSTTSNNENQHYYPQWQLP